MEDQNIMLQDSYVTLVLENERLKVNKQQLISKSDYFRMLLSTKFNDHRLQEHNINYKIPHCIFLDFINWIESDEVYILDTGCSVHKSLNKFCCNFEGCLELLHLCTLFEVDNLIEEIIDIIESYWLKPDKAIEIWQVAKDLNIYALQAVSLATCLNYFNELPIDKLLQLTKSELTKLIGNINLECTESDVSRITSLWIEHNGTEMHPINTITNCKQQAILQTIAAFGEEEDLNVHLFCWSGGTVFQHFTVPYPTELKNGLTGMQFIARRYDLYICGGEYGIGRGKFNNKIWRYSRISKKWFIEACMPTSRRHMIVAFMGDKLLLVGGAGKYRLKMQSVDIFDIHMRIWTKGADIPEAFTSVPESSTCDDKLIIYSTRLPYIYVYCINQNIWLKVIQQKQYIQPAVLLWRDTFYIDFKFMKIFKCVLNNKEKCSEECSCEVYRLQLTETWNFFDKKQLLYNVTFHENSVNIFTDDSSLNENEDCYLHIQCSSVQDLDKISWLCKISPVAKLFSMLDPNYLLS